MNIKQGIGNMGSLALFSNGPGTFMSVWLRIKNTQ